VDTESRSRDRRVLGLQNVGGSDSCTMMGPDNSCVENVSCNTELVSKVVGPCVCVCVYIYIHTHIHLHNYRQLALCGDVFMDFIHRPNSKILNIFN
jgi:hypothetical protein